MTADLAWLTFLVVLPGSCATVAVCARGASLSVPTACAFALAAGYTICGTVALVLAIAGHLSGAAMMGGTVLVCAGALGIAWGARRPAAWRPPIRSAFREAPWPLAVGVLGVALIAGSTARFDPAFNLANEGRWTYWADGREIAMLGHIPSVTPQWGTEFPTTVSKVLLNCFTAGFSTLAGGQAVPAFGAFYVLASLGTALALWALAWELGLRWSAVLLPVLLLVPLHLHTWRFPAAERFIFLPGLYRAETIGRMVAFTALAMAVRALLRGQPWLAVAAGVLLGAAAITHGVPTMAAVLLGVSLGVAWLMVHRQVRPLVRTAALVAVPAALFASVAVLASGGTAGLSGAGSRYAPVNGADPTALFRGSDMPLRNGTFYVQPVSLAKRLVAAALGYQPFSHWWLAFLVGVIVVAVGLRVLPRDLAWLPTASAGFLLLMFLVALVFSARSNAYIPATFPHRRLYDYAVFAIVLCVLAWTEAAARWLGRFRLTAAVSGVVVVAAVAAVVAWDMRPPRVSPKASALAAAMTAVHQHVPCGARILANRETKAFEVLAGRENVLGGMAPYLRPGMLIPVLHQIAAAKQALSGSPSGRDFLRRQHVGYVVLLAGKGGLATARDREALASTDWLHRVFTDPSVTIYRVAGGTPGMPPPGFDCGATPTGA